jgi:hypothetical protein
MSEMDLNIDNYSVIDLENFFKLKSKKYQVADVEKREYEIREQLLSSGHVNKKFKRDLIIFLEEAKNRLLQTLPQIAPPTTIQKNAILDTLQVPRSAELPTSRAPFIIERPPTQYINVQTSEYYQGIMNPLNTRTITQYLTVDTRFRDRYTQCSSSNFSINLQNRINKVVAMQLTSIELPKTFYNISGSYGNNFFFMQLFQKINGVGFESTRVIVVPDGNYTDEGLIDEINNILAPVDSSNNLVNMNDPFSYIQFLLVASDDGSGPRKVIVRVNPEYPSIASTFEEVVLNFATDVNGNIDTRYISSKLGWNLGFIKMLYEGDVEYISEKVIEPNAIKYIYLAVDDYNKSVNNTFMTAFETNGLRPNILARISMHGKGYDNIIINDNCTILTEPRTYFGPVDIQRLNINLFDDHGRTLHMNYSDYSFCLKLVVMYDL